MMGETGRAGTGLEVSVSFGRFEHDDSLSWEKWSSFSPNKYLEEVGKYSTPGSVAQKKAYFEAHYKKIAAQKAEQSDQEKLISSPTTPTRDESDKKSHVKLTYVGDEEIEVSSNGRSGEDLDFDLDLDLGAGIESALSRSDKLDESSQIKHKKVKDSEFDVLVNGKTEENLEQEIVNLTSFKDGKEDYTSINEDRQECSIMEAEENSNDASNYIESNQISHESDIVEPPSSMDVGKANGTLVKKNKIMKAPLARDIARKISIPKKEPNPPDIKKKVASTIVKKSTTNTKFSPESTPGLSITSTTKFSPESTIPGLSKSITNTTKFSPKSITPGLSKSITSTTKFSPESITPGSSKSITSTTKFLPESTIPGLSKSITSSTKFSSESTTPGLSKSTIMPTKKTTKSSLSKSNFTSPGEHKRAIIPATTSLHMSMSLDKGKQPLPSSSAITNRKSLIMEQMGDKDIVKRAFKTFQKQFMNNGVTSSSNEKSKMSDTGSDQKITRGSIRRTDNNERLRRSVEKTKSNHHSPLMLHKSDGEERKKSLSIKLKSDAKLMEKEANLKKSKQGLNFKAAAAAGGTTPPYNRATNIKTRIPSPKEDNMKNHHHQQMSGKR